MGNERGKHNVTADLTRRKPGSPMTDAEKALARKLLADGVSVAETARRIGVGSNAISRFRKIEGLGAVPAHDNTAGTQAFKRDAAAKRAERTALLDELFAHQAKYLRAVQLKQEKYKAILKGAMGAEDVVELDFIPAPDWRSETTSLSVLATAIERADDKADDGGLARAQSMLTMILQGLSGKKIEVPEDQGTFES